MTTVNEPEMVNVPSGTFEMGSKTRKKWLFDNEKPQHSIELPGYWIGKYPVTNSEYAVFVGDTDYRCPDHWLNGKIPMMYESHPVIYVSWHDASAYCRWLSDLTGKPYRLPTEAQWEKAARGGDGRRYPWGSRWDSRKCNTQEGGHGETSPVGAYSPEGDSPFGCADMAGNVWEWTSSLYRPYPYDTNDGREDLGNSIRVLRGGSWANAASYARCASRVGCSPVSRSFDSGFRLAYG